MQKNYKEMPKSLLDYNMHKIHTLYFIFKHYCLENRWVQVTSCMYDVEVIFDLYMFWSINWLKNRTTTLNCLSISLFSQKRKAPFKKNSNLFFVIFVDIWREGEDVYIECRNEARPTPHIINFKRNVIHPTMYFHKDSFPARINTLKRYGITSYLCSWNIIGVLPEVYLSLRTQEAVGTSFI